MSALAQCDAFAFIYDQAGDPAPDVLVVLKRVLDASGNPILLGPKTTLTDSAGSFHFTLPELATAFISARASALWNCPEGRAFTVPPGPSGELVPDFSLPASTLVEPPLVYVGDVLSIPKASASQDGYLSAADFVAFEAGGAEVGVTQINTGAGLTGGPITDTGTIGLLPVSGVAGTYSNPASITINGYGQVIAISGVADTTAPVISAISATSVTSSGATILWTTDDFSDSQVEYGTTTSYGSTTTLATTPVTSHSVPITGTAASTLYHYRVKSRNTAGLLTTSGDNTFTTLTGPDITAPVISAIASSGLTDNAATITWTTDEASDSQVEYGLTTSYGSSTTLATAMVTSHSVPIAALTASTLYHYRVKSRDAASNLATSTDNTFTTTGAVANTLRTGLVSMWKLDETGATTARADSKGTNTANVTGSVPDTAGKINQGLQFSGALANRMIIGGTDPQMGDINFAFACWVKLGAIDADRDFITKAGSGSGDEYMIAYDHSLAPDRFRFSIRGAAYAHLYATSIGAPVVGTWYLIVAWHDFGSNSLNIQVNGGAVDTLTPVPPINTGGDPLAFGSYGDGVANPFSGVLDEVGMWKGVVLGATDRAALWHGGAGLPFSLWT